MRGLILFALRFFNRPSKVIGTCLFGLAFTLVVNGSLMGIIRLHKEQNRLNRQIKETQAQIISLDEELKRVQDPEFVKHQAHDRFNIVGASDVLFIFPD